MTLYKIGAELTKLEGMLEENGGVLDDPALEAYVLEQLALIDEHQQERADAYCSLIHKAEAMSEAARLEANRYSDASKVQANFAARLKQRLKEHMEAHGIRKIETTTGRKIYVQQNGGKVPVVYMPGLQPMDLDPEYQKMTVAVDGERVRAALEAGKKLKFAEFGERGTSLRIK